MQLYSRDIIDVGAAVSPSLERFFSTCEFGDDTEQSVTMYLSKEAAMSWAMEGEGRVRHVLRKRR